MNVISIDEYTVRARLAPAVIAVMPAFAFAAIFVSWGKLGLPHVIASLGLMILFAAFSDIARRRGRKIEPGLIAKMGGLPSTTMLRHRDDSFDAGTKAKVHAFLASKLVAPAPSAAQETADPKAADDWYARGGTWLRENTRDTRKFRLLFNENISYGFRRNLLGLRMPGLLLNVAIVLTCAGVLAYRWPIDLDNYFNDALIAVIAASAIHAAYLSLAVTEDSVFDAARLYARQLILSVEKLDKVPTTTTTTRSRVTKQS
ncbi:hypothetical protein IVA88_01325 [Bradyrhizobium sp. 149]|uniref:hypothetical protein n=1 Tax=Bradyrhizobium sp. 149 TaxID=2782624 RepID=UPI001FFAE64D|nr:hypothetical protein [Bradyrhizobium sp. 149]MCK1650078.1 hypothetical protein [Bradyrhizobium sp. 149]